MTSYKTTFRQIRQSPSLKELITALEAGFEPFGIDYYLVGAVSKEIWMSGLNGITPARSTTDIDFAIFLNDKGIYEQLKDYLIQKQGFREYKGNAFVLIWKDGTEVDLLPFGAIEDENRKVTVVGTGYTSIHVDGFMEVYKQGLPEVELDGSSRFKFCTIPGIVLLKLIAWDDRPEARRDDIKDISNILHYFFNIYKERIWEEHSDLFEDEKNELGDIAARVMGREIKKIVRGNEKLSNRIRQILSDNIDGADKSRIAAIMAEYFDDTISDNLKKLTELYKGFEDNLTD